MKPIAITVCVNYSDFLAWSALINQNLFKKWYICTVKEDKATIDICHTYGLTPVFCDFNDNGKFNKFKGINKALELIKENDWVLFLDSDILFPPITKRVFSEMSWNKQNLYGCDRVNFNNMPELLKYIDNPNKLIKDNWLVDLDNLSVGARICHYYGQQGDGGKFDGWNPLGFFQMAHMDYFEKYPFTEKNGFDHCDLLFSKMWHRSRRILIPEIIAIHIASERVWGQNWDGRKSKDFKETLKEDY